MKIKKITPTIVCGLSAAVVAHEARAHLCLKEPEKHLEAVIEQPTNPGKFEIVTEVRSDSAAITQMNAAGLPGRRYGNFTRSAQ